MLQRRRRTPRPIAIVDLAREVLEAGERASASALWGGTGPEDICRLLDARESARIAGYAIGVIYCDAIRERGSRLRRSRFASTEAKKLRLLDHAAAFLAISETAAIRLRADVGT
jgi:hypothetical protein